MGLDWPAAPVLDGPRGTVGEARVLPSGDPRGEDPDYLQSQFITCLGNKRALLDLVGEGVAFARARLGGRKLDIVDAFSGSGVVSRYLRAHANRLWSIDLESYARVAGECYLTDRVDFPALEYAEARDWLDARLSRGLCEDGILARLYAPADDTDIRPGERVFYTRRNARYLDTVRSLVEEIAEPLRPYFVAPLLAEASVHANTAGVFKGFYKDSATGIGRFGGRKGDALARITGDIELKAPVLSRLSCETTVLQGDANLLCPGLPELDLAYLDPPYNQHPYGSNYFMLNLIVDYREPEAISRVSGIPRDWRRSAYNRSGEAVAALQSLVEGLKAKFIIVSFNSEGFVGREEMLGMLGRHGKVSILERPYNAFRGSRNLGGRERYVREFLFVLERS